MLALNWEKNPVVAAPSVACRAMTKACKSGGGVVIVGMAGGKKNGLVTTVFCEA